RSRTQPRRTALGQPEGRRIGQPLRGRPRTSAAPGACGLPPDPEPACARSWFLAPCRLGLLTCVSLYLTGSPGNRGGGRPEPAVRRRGGGRVGAMRDVELARAIRGLTPPWTVVSVELDVSGQRVVVQVDAGAGPFVCPECGTAGTRYDRKPRRWRHL